MRWPATSDGRRRSQAAPLGTTSSLALVQRGDAFSLLPTTLRERREDPFRMAGAVPDLAAEPLLRFATPGIDLLDWAAAITAASMAGAMARVLDVSLPYVSERPQFGRSAIGSASCRERVCQVVSLSVGDV